MEDQVAMLDIKWAREALSKSKRKTSLSGMTLVNKHKILKKLLVEPLGHSAEDAFDGEQ